MSKSIKGGKMKIGLIIALSLATTMALAANKSTNKSKPGAKEVQALDLKTKEGQEDLRKLEAARQTVDNKMTESKATLDAETVGTLDAAAKQWAGAKSSDPVETASRESLPQIVETCKSNLDGENGEHFKSLLNIIDSGIRKGNETAAKDAVDELAKKIDPENWEERADEIRKKCGKG
jgi:hypothetical protein